MQIVIDIPKEMMSYINKNEFNAISEAAYGSMAIFAIQHGTPLPKGHGRLKDSDAICKDIISALGIRDENYLLEAEKAVYKRIKNAPTIIEADREGVEE